MSARSSFWRGVRHGLPVAASVVPFAIVVALAASEAGLSPLETMGMSVVVFAGAAQLVALELARSDAPAAIIIGAAVVVNLRFVLYSAAMAPYVRGLPRRVRAAMAYVLTDQAFALTVQQGATDEPAHSGAFFTGVAVLLWVVWQAGTGLGIVIGSSVPPELSLDFAVALVFIGVVVPALDSGAAVAAAASAIAVYLLARDLPYGLGLLPAAVVGIAVGGGLARQVRA